MNRIVFRSIVTLLAFAFGVGIYALAIWVERRQFVVSQLDEPPCLRPPYYENTYPPCTGADFSALQDLPSIEFCNLVASPDVYDGKIVRVYAHYFIGRHGSILYDEKCMSLETSTAVSFHPMMEEEIYESLIEGSSGIPFGALAITAVGRFKVVNPTYESDRIGDTASLEFEIMNLEKVSPTFAPKQ